MGSWSWLADIIYQEKQFVIERNKETTKLSQSRYSATKNTFLVYHYFDLFEETITYLGLKNKPEVIWNCDVSGLPHGPKKLKIVSAKGQKSFPSNCSFLVIIYLNN